MTEDTTELPAALRTAAVAVISERGLSGFSLREVARRAGVSHAAPGYHFHNAAGLLTALAIEAFVRLRESQEAAIAGIDDPVDRFVALGQAYVRTGLSYPAHCEVAFRTDVVDQDDPDLQAAGIAAYSVLERTVQELADRDNPGLDVGEAADLAWSAMQGLLVLLPKMTVVREVTGRGTEDAETTAARFCRLLAAGFRAAGGPARNRSGGRGGT